MPEATVAAIITPADSSTGEILLTRRNVEPFKGQWCLPGGHIHRYEAAQDAIVREVKEETGLDFDARFFSYFDERVSERGIHAVVLAFTGRGTGPLRAQEGEVSEIGWFSMDEARSLPLAFTHNEILDAYVAQMNDGETRKTGYAWTTGVTPRPTFDETEIRSAERALEQALAAPDPTAWVSHYTEDAIFVGPGYPAVQGRAALLEMARAMTPLSSVSITALRTEGSGNLAYAYGTASWVTGRPPNAGAVTNVRFVIIWRKEADGQWRVTQELLNANPATT